MNRTRFRERLLKHALNVSLHEPIRDGDYWVFANQFGSTIHIRYTPDIQNLQTYFPFAVDALTKLANAPKPRPSKGRSKYPSKNVADQWLYAEPPGETSTLSLASDDTNDKVGKWMMFIARGYVDDTWKNVSAAMRDGRLAPAIAAKISTAADAPYGRPHVLCVYLADSTDRDAAIVVRDYLREMGFKRKIHYKTNAMTREGISGSLFRA